MTIEVIGHQWWWEFRYPEANITTANEMYIPAGRTVELEDQLGRRGPQLLAPALRRQARRLSGPRDAALVEGRLDRALPRPVRRVLRDPACADGVPRPLGDAAGFRGLGRSHEDARVRPSRRRRPPRPAAGDSLRTASAGAKVQGAQDSAAAGAPAQGAEYAAGEKLFMTKGCMGCHSLQAVGAPKG